jgi:hypothetical protein
MKEGMIPVRAPTPKPVKTRPPYIMPRLEVVAVIKTTPTRKMALVSCMARTRPMVSLEGQAKMDPKKPAARYEDVILAVLDVR